MGPWSRCVAALRYRLVLLRFYVDVPRGCGVSASPRWVPPSIIIIVILPLLTRLVSNVTGRHFWQRYLQGTHFVLFCEPVDGRGGQDPSPAVLLCHAPGEARRDAAVAVAKAGSARRLGDQMPTESGVFGGARVQAGRRIALIVPFFRERSPEEERRAVRPVFDPLLFPSRLSFCTLNRAHGPPLSIIDVGESETFLE